jgi:hypothetical protein
MNNPVYANKIFSPHMLLDFVMRQWNSVIHLEHLFLNYLFQYYPSIYIEVSWWKFCYLMHLDLLTVKSIKFSVIEFFLFSHLFLYLKSKQTDWCANQPAN